MSSNPNHFQIPASEAAERASALLFRTIGAHRLTVAAIRERRRPRLPPEHETDPVQDQCQATLIRLLSITESFAAGLLSSEIDSEASAANSELVSKIAEDAVLDGTASWNEQENSYKNWLGIREDWKTVGQLAEARNSVAHGLGKLTRRQKKKEQSVRTKLKAVGINVHDDNIVLSDDILAAAAESCRDFIERLDRAVSNRRLSLK